MTTLYIDESRPIWSSQITLVNESCHGRWGHMDGRRCLMTMMTPYVNESRPMWNSHVTCERVMSRQVGSYGWQEALDDYDDADWLGVSHVNEWCLAFNCVISHMWMSQVTHVNAIIMMTLTGLGWIMSHMWMSCVTYEWVMSHIYMIHVTRMNESCHTYKWVRSHI